MSAFALGGYGLRPPAGRHEPDDARPAAGLPLTDPRCETHLALVLLAGASACIYAIAGATLVGRLPGTGAPLLAGAALQAAWLIAMRGRPAAASVAGALLNALLLGTWIVSRTVGLPIGAGAPAPVGPLDALCAAGAAVIVVLALAHRRPPAGRLARASAGLSQIAILLAVASLAALADGHTQRRPVATQGTPAPAHPYCTLL